MICRTCKIEKDTQNFYYRRDTNAFRLHCKACLLQRFQQYRQLNRQKINFKQNMRYKNSEARKEMYRASRRKLKFGIDKLTFNNMKNLQNNKCAICQQNETATLKGRIKDLAIDHCHKTGAIRKLLCQNCNIGLGCFKDNTYFLKNAVEYLNAFKLPGQD